CGRPIVVASSTQCLRFRHHLSFCSFAAKDFAAIDPVRGRLYMSYADFPVVGNGGNPIDLSVCDIGTKSGHAGPAGGTPARPVCKHGTPLVFKAHKFGGSLFTGKPYFKVAAGGRRGCENEGAYPAVDLKNGSVYVGWEFNWATNIFSFACLTGKTKTRDFITNTPRHCLTMSAVAACAHPASRSAVPVVSLDSAFVPGYNRFPLSDFPR